MTKDEALRLALEAMKINNKAWKLLADSGDAGNWEAEEQGYYQLNEQAINAIKEALETKDEPVAWMVWGHDNVPSLTFTKPADKYVFDSLYMTPPQRTWVGLTDGELPVIKHKGNLVSWCETKRAYEIINKALKEKNNG